MSTILSKEELFLVELCWKEINHDNWKLLDLDLLVEASHKHKLMPTLLSFFEDNDIEFKLNEKYQRVILRYQEERNFWMTILKIIDTQSNILKEDFFILKGFAFEKNYPNAAHRFAVDMDVLLVNEKSFWAIIDLLKINGIEMPGMFLLFRSFMDDNLEGIARLCISNEKVDGGLELHLRRFQATKRTWIHVDQLNVVNGFDEIAIDEVRVKTPNQSDSFLIFLYEMITREQLSIRDYYDVFHLTSRVMTPENKTYLNSKIADFGLTASLLKINQGFVALGINPSPLFQEVVAEHEARLLVKPLGFHEKKFFSNLGLVKSLNIKTIMFVRDKMDRWVDKNKFMFFLKITDYRVITRLLFNLGFPIFCVELFPRCPEKAVISKIRLVKKRNNFIYLMGANNLLTDEDLNRIEES